MSGPKVVHIVTLEEVIATCERHLHRLEQTIERWEERARKIGELTDSEYAATLARRDQLRALLTEGRLLELQKEVPIEIDSLQRDLAEREERAIIRAEKRRRWQRRLQENAAVLLQVLRARPGLAATELLKSITTLAQGTQRDDAETLLAQGFALLSAPVGQETLSDAQRDLALRLKDDEAQLSLDEWIARRQQDAPHEQRMARIDRHISELQLLQGQGSALVFLEKLEKAGAEQRPLQRNLLLDSLIVDVAQATRNYRQQRERLDQLQDLAGEVAALANAEHTELLQQIAACHAETGTRQMLALMEQCNAIISGQLQEQASLARRQAVLQGLASLGYEVREGMDTAWAETGKVVLRKTATPGYGVEIGGKADRLQLRAVALTSGRDTLRDRDIETIWCSEFQRLQALLKAQGSELNIERALAIGEVPLKEMAIEADGAEARVVQHRRL